MNEKIEIKDIINDDSNFNKGTDEGNRLLNQSINEHGFGRSILIDKNNRIISGNKSFDVAKEIIQKIRVIESTGNQLIAVKRIDIDLDSKEGREMALADNSVSLTNLNWDKDMISSVTAEFKINNLS